MADPFAVPAKTLGYAKYDLVRVLNRGLDTFGLRGSIVEKVLARTLAVPAARFFSMIVFAWFVWTQPEPVVKTHAKTESTRPDSGSRR